MARTANFYSPGQKSCDWGYVLGVMASDGSKPYLATCRSRYGKSYIYPQVTLAVSDKDFVTKFQKAICEITGRLYAINFRINRRTTAWYLTVCHTQFVRHLASLTNWGKYTWEVPQIVWDNLDMAKGFLSGYFDGDGTVQLSRSNVPRRRKAPQLEFSSVNIKGLQGVQSLLLLFNIGSTLSTRPNRKIYTLHHLKISRKLDVVRYANLIGIELPRKRKALVQGIEEYLSKIERQSVATKISPAWAAITKE